MFDVTRGGLLIDHSNPAQWTTDLASRQRVNVAVATVAAIDAGVATVSHPAVTSPAPPAAVQDTILLLLAPCISGTAKPLPLMLLLLLLLLAKRSFGIAWCRGGMWRV